MLGQSEELSFILLCLFVVVSNQKEGRKVDLSAFSRVLSAEEVAMSLFRSWRVS